MAMTLTPQDHEEIEFSTPGRRRKVTKFALAGVAVLGVGAALTSAAWSDNVWFGGDATTGDLDLLGRATPTDAWAQGADAGAAIALPTDALTNVGPGQTDTHTVQVLNDGTVDVFLNSIVADPDENTPLFDSPLPADAVIGDVTIDGTVVSGTDRILGPGEIADIEIRVTGDALWTNLDYVDSSGALTVQVSGTSNLP